MPPCHPYNNFFRIFIICGKGHYASASTYPRYFFSVPPCHIDIPKKFRYCHYCCEAALCVCFNLAKVFLQSATMPSLHHFFGVSLWEGALCFFFDLARYFFRVPPCHPYTIFLIVNWIYVITLAKQESVNAIRQIKLTMKLTFSITILNRGDKRHFLKFLNFYMNPLTYL